jgi:Secretion system C-terminal sorting domain
MMKLVAILLMLLSTRVVAQNTFAASGGNASASNGNTAYSIGQMFTDTYSNGSIQSISGIVQPYEINEVLPLHWLNLTAQLQNHHALLMWEATNNSTLLYFDIEKQHATTSIFSSIGRINAKTTTTPVNNYQFIDSNTYSGANYYRIKQVEASNKVNYSNLAIVTLHFEELVKLNIYPNPVATHLQINLQVPISKTYQLLLQDANGRILLTKMINCIVGQNRITWNIAQLAAGAYYLKAIAPQSTPITLPIIKN